MRVQTLTLAAAGAALLAPVTLPAAAHQEPPSAPPDSTVSAADLLARLRGCKPVSKGRYRTDAGTPATIPVCGVPGAVFWKADMDVDCDGRPGPRCNGETDPWFQPTTAFRQSDGRYPSAETLPSIVVPAPSHVWNYRKHGIRGGSVAVVIHEDRVQYAVVGDTGPKQIIGEASYATAQALGIRPDPRTGGTNSGVTYLVFKDSHISAIEDQEEAAAKGEELLRRFVGSTDESCDVPRRTLAPPPHGRGAGGVRCFRDLTPSGTSTPPWPPPPPLRGPRLSRP